ncbi:DUF6452 family protein [Capnocytophaga sp. ARDL2]|uniref:DUF6452 family protein n=1 Tax=Capnocytophaga sp. ARDL2 TaxID=3238809 RepID=UPI003557B2E7
MSQFLKILITFLSLFTIFSCEKNDLCDGESQTPRFRIELHDLFAPENKKAAKIIRMYFADTEQYIEYKNTPTLYIPLSPVQNSAEWTLKLYDVTSSNEEILLGEEQFLFTYTPKNIYISKACGFRTQFEAFSYQRKQNNTQWIRGLDLTTNTISNETDTHFILYY